MSFLTDDVFKSTIHRAVNRSGQERYSIPLFFGTDYDVKLEVTALNLAYFASNAYLDTPSLLTAVAELRLCRFPAQVRGCYRRGLCQVSAGSYIHAFQMKSMFCWHRSGTESFRFYTNAV